MPKEYIEREAAIDKILQAIPYHFALQTGLERAINYIREVPSADLISREEYNLLLEENEKLKKKLSALQGKISRMKSSASWDEDIRRGQVQGMW